MNGLTLSGLFRILWERRAGSKSHYTETAKRDTLSVKINEIMLDTNGEIKRSF